MKAAPTVTPQQKRLQELLQKEVGQIEAACKKVEREIDATLDFKNVSIITNYSM